MSTVAISQHKTNKSETWKWVKLGNACEIIMGQSPPSETYNINQRGLPFFQGKAEFTDLHPVVEKWCTEPKKIALPNDILLSVRAPVGTTNIADIKCCIGRGLAALRYPNYKYLFYFLRSIQQELDSKGTGTTFRAISGETIRETQFPEPSPETQEKIVSKIEELFSELDKGIENLKLAQQQLQVYRQSVLKWAFEGRLTNEDVKEGELPEGWSVVQVKEVADTIGGYAFKSGEFLTSGKFQVLRMGNVRPGILRFDENPIFLTKVDKDVLTRSLLKINDVIITQTGTRKKRDYGFTAMITKDNLLLNQRITSIRFKPSYLPKFFLYYSWTDGFKDQFFANETGNVGQGNVGMKAVTETFIPFCNLQEQHAIVDVIESRLSVADKMEESIIQSLQQSEMMRQSVLKRAFEGNLI